MFVLFVYLIILAWIKPYTDNIMNYLETILTSMLLLLGTIGIVNTAYPYASDKTIREFLRAIDMAKFILLLLPLPVWIVCAVKHKRSNATSKAQGTQTPDANKASQDIPTCVEADAKELHDNIRTTETAEAKQYG